MQELEAKFLNINKEEIIARLKQIGARKVFDENLYRRCVYDIPSGKDRQWVRVRDEGDKVTMSFKHVMSQDVEGVREIELKIDSFEKAREFLKAIGLKERAYQENKRMRFVLATDENVEFDIDTWPGLNPYVEIEADTKEKVMKYAKALGLKWEDAMFGRVTTVYQKVFDLSQDWSLEQYSILTFDNIPSELNRGNKE